VTGERLVEVALAVIAGQLVAGLDVADCDLSIAPERPRVGVAVVVDVAACVPAQHVAVEVIDVGVALDDRSILRAEGLELGTGEDPIEAAADPRQGALGDPAGGPNAMADLGADPAELGVGVNHERLSSSSLFSELGRTGRERSEPAYALGAIEDPPASLSRGREHFSLAPFWRRADQSDQWTRPKVPRNLPSNSKSLKDSHQAGWRRVWSDAAA
jgi:hypothetical protein